MNELHCVLYTGSYEIAILIVLIDWLFVCLSTFFAQLKLHIKKIHV